MDNLRAAAEKAKEIAKKAAKNIRRFAKFIAALPFIIKIVAIIALISIVAVIVDFIVEIVTSNNTANAIYSTLEVEDLKELVEIKESPDGSGYYIDFKDGTEDKLEQIVDDSLTKSGIHNLPDSTDFLKKIIKAELATQFPDLGGNVPEDSDGFQGTVKIRRITPNKEIGSMESPSRDTVTTIEPDTSYDPDSASADENEVHSWQSGQKLYTTENAVVYEQKESEINPGSDTGYWYAKIVEGSTSTKERVEKGTEVTYTGTYKKSTNPLSNHTVIYVQVQNGDETVYLMSTNLTTTNPNTQATSSTENSRNTRVAVTSRAGELTEDKIVGDDPDKTFTVAIGAGHNNTDNTGARSPDGTLKEEDLTIQVAEKVEELLKEYKNVKVVQVGSTSANPGGVKVEDRTKLAREANPDLCIQIHFNSGGGTGVETIYKDGDGISQQLAEMLADSISSAMGLTNRGAGTDIEKANVGSLGIIENAATSQFPSVVTEGGFLDNNTDYQVIKNGDGITKYAQGIVNGILEYLVADHSGYTSTVTTNQQVQESIESRVYNLRYVTPDEMDGYINSNDQEALRCFTLDENNNVITATWSYDGSIHIVENAPADFRTVLQKYMMPYEYLLFFYIDTNETAFPERLADEVLNSEIILAVQDNVTTTQTVTTTYTRAPDSNVEQSSTSETVTETCTPQIEITYADTWCVKFSKESSYSDEELGWQDGDTEKIINVKGTVTVTSSGASSSEYTDENGNVTRSTSTTTQMVIKYDSGDSTVEGNENKFVKAFQETNMVGFVRESYILRLIEDNERTANLLDLTKYLLYKATNDNLGVIEFDFSQYNINSFVNIDGDYGDWDGTGSQQDFINAIAPYAVIDMEQHQIYASVTIAQAIIESGWGKDDIAVNYNNYFGMKAGSGSPNEYWSGKSVTLNASEGGQSAFRVYDSLKNSVYDHGRNFTVTSTYATHGVLDCIPQNLGPREQLRRIALSGYAVYADGSISRPDGVRTYDQYLYEEFIQPYNLEQYDKMSPSDFQTATGETNSQIVEIAKTKLGCPYVWGATGPDTFDCSGLVQWVYKQVGISLPRTTADYIPYLGTSHEISWSEAQPGDIVWKSGQNGGSGHMGIYLGGNQYLHAPQTGDVVKISNGAQSMFTNVLRFTN